MSTNETNPRLEITRLIGLIAGIVDRFGVPQTGADECLCGPAEQARMDVAELAGYAAHVRIWAYNYGLDCHGLSADARKIGRRRRQVIPTLVNRVTELVALNGCLAEVGGPHTAFRMMAMAERFVVELGAEVTP